MEKEKKYSMKDILTSSVPRDVSKTIDAHHAQMKKEQVSGASTLRKIRQRSIERSHPRPSTRPPAGATATKDEPQRFREAVNKTVSKREKKK